jgi:hypothetical protein
MGFFPDIPISATNKNDCHDITELLFKVTLNTITLFVNSRSIKEKEQRLVGSESE